MAAGTSFSKWFFLAKHKKFRNLPVVLGRVALTEHNRNGPDFIVFIYVGNLLTVWELENFLYFILTGEVERMSLLEGAHCLYILITLEVW